MTQLPASESEEATALKRLFGKWGRRRNRRWVSPTTNRIVKLWPSSPPDKGEIVLVDDERCRVTRSIVRWSGRTWVLNALEVEPVSLSKQREEA